MRASQGHVHKHTACINTNGSVYFMIESHVRAIPEAMGIASLCNYFVTR